MKKIITLENLSLFWKNVKEWLTSKLDILDKKIDKQIFQGTQEELQAAIVAGEVDEETLIILTDTIDPPIYESSSDADISNLFPEYNK